VADKVKEANMAPLCTQILIVADDRQTAASITNDIVCSLEANVTIIDSLAESRALAATDQFDVILAAETLADGHGVELLDAQKRTCETPVILIAGAWDADRTLHAMREGAKDILPQPIDRSRLLSSIRVAVDDNRLRKHLLRRSERLRRVCGKLVRDRRELRKRVDLICRDLVYAYRRLAKKDVEIQLPDMPAGSQHRIDPEDAHT